MWTRGLVRNLKSDAVPRTIGLIEQFIWVIAVTFDTMHATESQYVNCIEYVVMTLKGLRSATEHPCRIESGDS